MQKQTYLEATPEASINFYKQQQEGEIVMLNLLKFRDKADYSMLENASEIQERTGQEAYQVYMDAISPTLSAMGSEVLFYGQSNAFLIGPEFEKWDVILLVKHASAAQFIAFSQMPAYTENVVHRTAALEDSRLLPSQAVEV